VQGSLRTVIAGGGRVGRRTAQLLDDRGHDVVIIEDDPDLVEELSDEYIATVIKGDGTRPRILEQADLDRTDVVAALTGLTGANLAICMLAERLTDGVTTVMRTDEENPEEYAGYVDEVVFPERAGARAAANAVERDVRALEDVTGNLEIMEIRVAEGAPVAGRSLMDVALPRGSLVVSNDDGNRIAGSETVLEAGRSYVVAVEPDVADEVMNLMRG
jgi:trk system potassium uptake protein TrkA